MEHTYTIKEIDDLRSACSIKWHFGTLRPGVPGSCTTGRSYSGNEADIAIEQRVRTYMLGGIKAKDLYEAEGLVVSTILKG